MENNVIVSDYTQMDRVLREERQYILDICKKVKKAGCNVLLIQKSILRYVVDLINHNYNYAESYSSVPHIKNNLFDFRSDWFLINLFQYIFKFISKW